MKCLRTDSTPLSVVLALALVSGCGVGEPASGPRIVVDELPSPARAGSEVPHLGVDGSRVVLSWLEEGPDGGHTLYMDELADEGWTGRRPVASSDRFFVNWADFPSVIPLPDGSLVAHWLLRGGSRAYDYGIRTSVSDDDGATWSRPWKPHTDDTPTEHGFVSTVAVPGGGWGLVWLDGRDFARHPEGADDGAEGHEHPEGPEMSLRFRTSGPAGGPGPERLLDGRTCDCCQTDLVRTGDDLLVAYRDRSPEEVRDVYVTRRVDGRWTDPAPVHRDGWVFPACPVNGPAAAARGDRVAVAWFTGARDTARVRVAFSGDGGATFGEPVRVDDGNPAGRVDVVLRAGGDAVVSWLERTGGEAEIRLRSVRPGREAGPVTTVARSSESRASGFPAMVATAEGALVLAWTDVRADAPRVRIARVRIDGVGPEGGRIAGGAPDGDPRGRP